MKRIYLDYASATPLDPAVLKVMRPYFSEKFHNPSATYLAARAVRQDLERARADIAGCLGARPPEIIFTAGATEANNLAIQGAMKQNPDGEALVLAIEHESVLEPVKLYKHRLVPVTKDGIIDLAKFKQMLSPKTVLVSVGLVNNEIGTIQPLREIAKILEGSSTLLHTDASQSPSQLDFQTSKLGVDLMSLNGGKIYGPKQSGALYIKTGTKLKPIILGGGQELNMRSGTENVAASIGFAKALSLNRSGRKEEAQRLKELKELFISKLEEAGLSYNINGSSKNGVHHIVSVTFPHKDNEWLMMELDEAGIQAAVGSACSASSDEPSHVLKAIGLSESDARATLRFSFGRQTTPTNIEKTAEILRRLTAV